MLNEIYITSGIQSKIKESTKFCEEFSKLVRKFFDRDWGDTCKSDCLLNDQAIKTKDRIVALYKTSEGNVFAITEYGHTMTTF